LQPGEYIQQEIHVPAAPSKSRQSKPRGKR
jgi:hypothetical protein